MYYPLNRKAIKARLEEQWQELAKEIELLETALAACDGYKRKTVDKYFIDYMQASAPIHANIFTPYPGSPKEINLNDRNGTRVQVSLRCDAATPFECFKKEAEEILAYRQKSLIETENLTRNIDSFCDEFDRHARVIEELNNTPAMYNLRSLVPMLRTH